MTGRVLIAGGGPVGLLCAGCSDAAACRMRLFDDNPGPRDDPRAATTHPSTLDLLSEDGLAEDMARRRSGSAHFPVLGPAERATGGGIRPRRFSPTTRAIPLTSCNASNSRRQNFSSSVWKNFPNVEVMFGHEVHEVAAGGPVRERQGPRSAGRRHPAGGYLIGADGGRSTRPQAMRHPIRWLHLARTL